MNTQEQLVTIFNNNFVAYFRSHAAHVNVTGRNFRSDHKLLQGVYERRQEQIDKIGEILRTMQEYMPIHPNTSQFLYFILSDMLIRMCHLSHFGAGDGPLPLAADDPRPP